MHITSSILINSSLPFFFVIFFYIHQHYSLPISSVLLKKIAQSHVISARILWVSHYQMDHGQALRSCILEEDYLEYFHSIKPMTYDITMSGI